MDRIYELCKKEVQDNIDNGLVTFCVEPCISWTQFENCLIGLPENATTDEQNAASKKFDTSELNKAESLAQEVVAKAFFDWLESQKNVFKHNFNVEEPYAKFKVTLLGKDDTTLKNIEEIKSWKPKN